MTTRTKIIRLEKRFLSNAKLKEGGLVVRTITRDGRLLDKDGYLLSAAEIRKIQTDNLEAKERGCTVVNLVSYSTPKVKPANTTILHT